MAVRANIPARNGRRVSLTRNGGIARPNTITRREPKPSREIVLPWREIGNTISNVLMLALLIILLAGVSLALVYGYRGLTSGEYFALKTIEIQGNSRLSSREILEYADLIEGANTLALSIDAVEDALSKHPWVAEVSVKRILPGTLLIGIKEKSPAFWMLHEGKLHYADPWGRLIAPVIPGKFASLPTLEIEQGAGDTAGALPDLVKSLYDSQALRGAGQIALLRLSAARTVEVVIEGSGMKIFIGLEDWLPNLRRLGLTLADLNRRGELSVVREIRALGANVWVERKGGTAA